MPYPVSLTIEPRLVNRNRLTTAFRLVLAIPHVLLVGGPMTFTQGLLGAVIWLLAVISWFTLVVSGQHPAGIRQFTVFYLRWHTRSSAYLMLLEDVFPPFGDGPYSVAVDVVDPAGPRDKATIAVRLIMVIPQLIVLTFVWIAWWIITVIAWFAIVLTGEYPAGLHQFSAGTLRWTTRVSAYLLLLVDEYPPFSLE